MGNPRSIGSAKITFGLLAIPVKLYSGTAEQRVHLNMLHKPAKGKCGSRLKQDLRCAADDVVVNRKDTVLGFEHVADQYVTFTAEEMKALDPLRPDELEIVEVVPAAAFDPGIVRGTRLLGPDETGVRAYRLLAQLLARTDRIALGMLNDQLSALRPHAGGLVLHECFFATEVRSLDAIEIGRTMPVKELELALGGRLLEQLFVATPDLGRFVDTKRARVLEAVARKVAGEQIVIPPPITQREESVDLLDALRRSIAPRTKKTRATGKASRAA